MIGYVTIGTDNIEKSGHFYDTLLAGLGAKRILENERLITWGNAKGSPMLGIIKPFNEGSAEPGNGNMTAIICEDRELVDRLHSKALSLGATNEGDPGPRGSGNFYGGYFRDLDGNKLVFFNM